MFLPELLVRYPDAETNRRLYKAMATLLWAQTRFGTFNVDLEQRLAVWPDRQRALDWLAVLEAMRLDARIAAELPGLAAEIVALRGPWPASLQAAADRLARPGATIADTLAVLADYMDSAEDPPHVAVVGGIDPVGGVAGARRTDRAGYADSAQGGGQPQGHGRPATGQ